MCTCLDAPQLLLSCRADRRSERVARIGSREVGRPDSSGGLIAGGAAQFVYMFY
jgi:hypothetical protein